MSDAYAEPTFDTEAARKVIENEKQDRQRRAARRLEEFVQVLRTEERCVVFAVPAFTQDGRVTAHLAVDALD